MITSVLCTARCFFFIRSWPHRKNSRPEKSCSRFFDISCSCNCSDGFFLGDSFLSRCRGSLHARGSADSPLFVCRDHSTPPLLGSKHGLGSAGFRWSYADNFWVVLARGANCTNVHLVYRKPASMITTYPLRAEVQMLKCLRPTHIAVERANGYHASALSRGRSLRTVAVAVGQWTSSMVASLFWRSAIVELSQSMMHASSSRGRLIWFQESLGQLWVWSKEHLVESYVFSEMIGAFAGLTSASARVHRKRASRSWIVKEAASWLRRLVESQSGRGSRGAPARSIRARSRALRSIAPEAGLECSSSDEHVM